MNDNVKWIANILYLFYTHGDCKEIVDRNYVTRGIFISHQCQRTSKSHVYQFYSVLCSKKYQLMKEKLSSLKSYYAVQGILKGHRKNGSPFIKDL